MLSHVSVWFGASAFTMFCLCTRSSKLTPIGVSINSALEREEMCRWVLVHLDGSQNIIRVIIFWLTSESWAITFYYPFVHGDWVRTGWGVYPWTNQEILHICKSYHASCHGSGVWICIYIIIYISNSHFLFVRLQGTAFHLHQFSPVLLIQHL